MTRASAVTPENEATHPQERLQRLSTGKRRRHSCRRIAWPGGSFPRRGRQVDSGHVQEPGGLLRRHRVDVEAGAPLEAGHAHPAQTLTHLGLVRGAVLRPPRGARLRGWLGRDNSVPFSVPGPPGRTSASERKRPGPPSGRVIGGGSPRALVVGPPAGSSIAVERGPSCWPPRSS